MKKKVFLFTFTLILTGLSACSEIDNILGPILNANSGSIRELGGCWKMSFIGGAEGSLGSISGDVTLIRRSSGGNTVVYSTSTAAGSLEIDQLQGTAKFGDANADFNLQSPDYFSLTNIFRTVDGEDIETPEKASITFSKQSTTPCE